jgi:hypothetical protein
MASLLLPLLAKTIGGGGQPDPNAAGAAVSSQYAELQGADPAKVVNDLKQMKSAISAIFPIAVERVADAAKGISQAVVGINAAIKAFEKAHETLQTTKPQQPLGLSFAQPQPMNPQAQNPMMGGTPF